MTIKAIIFDLDDTLYPKDQIRDSAQEQCVRAMIEKGLNCSFEQGLEKIKEISKDPRMDMFQETVKHFGPNNQEIWEYGHEIYNNANFKTLISFPETKELLEQLKQNFKLILITQGSIRQQDKKVEALGIRNYFDKVILCEDGEKENYFSKILEIYNLKPEEVLNIGDNILNEIEIANKLGMKTIRILEGKYSTLTPQESLETPDFTINNPFEIIPILNKLNNQENKNQQPKIVTIGGGTGTSPILEGLKKHTDNITTIVTVTDSGRSTGMLRKDLDMPAPGDTRNCLLALANSEELLYDLFQYRFENGNLEGYSFGNLFIAALTKLTGSFEKAIEEASKILKLKGRVIPSTFDNINICAELEDGNILEEEDKIIDRHNPYVHLRPKIKRVFHNPESKPNEKAIKEIEEADLIILSPGSLFTSIISNLIVKGISEAINRSKAKKVYICNIMTQVSQTYKFKASDHVKKILEYLQGNIDYVILNTAKPEQRLIEAYEKENAFLVENDFEELNKLGIKVITEEVLDKTAEKKLLWEKKDLLRHDADKIAEVLIKLIKD